MSCDSWLLYVVCLLANLAAMLGETEIYHHKLVIHGKTEGSLFGYSIAYQNKIKRLVIGAPKEDPIGHVHLCPIEKAGECENVDRGNITNDDNYSYWYGATVNAGDDFFMTCAPRYTTVSRTNPGFVSTYGHCYYAAIQDTSSRPSDINPMVEFTYAINDTYRKDFHKEAYGIVHKDTPELLSDTFGMSSYVYKDKFNTRIYVGGPFMSIGRVYQYNNANTDTDSKLIFVNNKDQKDKKVSYNFGYSITSGRFVPGYRKESIAISTPYGSIGYGRVYFYDDSAKRNKFALSTNLWVNGKEVAGVGSLFGACLASLPIATSQSALLVGAPAYVEGSGYDVGAVFIYTFKRDITHATKSELIKKLLPSKEEDGGHFGASIVTIGDFDKDNIPEVAVAAPFANNGRGVVHIYSGKQLLSGKTDSKVPCMQLLQPEDLTLSYGWSLMSTNDADDNGCDELVIGAPLNDSVTFMQCIASVEIDFSVAFKGVEDIYPHIGHIDTVFTFQPYLAVKYNNKPTPAKIQTNALITIEVIHPDVRLESGVNNSTTKTILKPLSNAKKTKVNNSTLGDFKVSLPKEADYDRKIMFSLSVNLVENPLEMSEFNPNLVLLNGGGANYSKQVSGPDLPASNVTFAVQTTLKDNYLIGSTEDAQLVIFMTNSGQTAHGPCVRTRLNGLTVSQMPTDRTCSVADGELICRLEKLTSGQNETRQVTLSMKSLTSLNESLKLDSELFTSNCLISTNRTQNITITLTKETNIMIKNSSIPGFFVNATKEELERSGKVIEHIYKIINNGFTVWKNLACKIVLPSQVKIDKLTIKPSRPEIENCVVNEHIAYCQLLELGKNKPIDIRIRMKIVPGSDFAGDIKSGKATVDTKLSLLVLDTISLRITTIVTLWQAPKVPLWMIIVASLVGILIIVILLWALHECGCLRRQNKQKLEDLKKEVKRQTMRRSMMLRQSAIEVIQNDFKKGEHERLIHVPEEDSCSNDFEMVEHQGIDTKGHVAKEKVDVSQTQSKTEGKSDKIDAQHTQQATELINVQPVKEKPINDNDPARVAFNAELAKAFAKGGKPVATKAEIH